MSENNESNDVVTKVEDVEPAELGLGDTVLYKLSTADAEAINRRRDDATARAQRFRSPDGTQVHVGNEVVKGDFVPAVITRISDSGHFNLKAQLDGSDDYWVTSRREGATAGTFRRK